MRVVTRLVLAATLAIALTGMRSPYIESIEVGTTYINTNDTIGARLQIHNEAVSYSGGATRAGVTVVLGGGHNNGFNDAVALLRWSEFETTGWVEEFVSTADLIGVSDSDYGAINDALAANYNPATPGGFNGFTGRGPGALSRHTYDGVAAVDDGFYIFGGFLPYDNPGQGSHPWANVEGDVWKYTYGVGWEFLNNDLTPTWQVYNCTALDTLTGNIWVHDEALRSLDTSTGSLGAAVSYGPVSVESWMAFSAERGAQGTLYAGGGYGSSGFQEYDIATNTWSGNYSLPGNRYHTSVFYVPAEYGPSYGTLFAYVSTTLYRFEDDSSWSTVATGGPSGDYFYGRAGFEETHQIFYAIWPSSGGWRTDIVRPYPFNDAVDETAPAAPSALVVE